MIYLFILFPKIQVLTLIPHHNIHYLVTKKVRKKLFDSEGGLQGIEGFRWLASTTMPVPVQLSLTHILVCLLCSTNTHTLM